MSRVFDPEKDERYNACVAMFESTNDIMRVKFLREKFSEFGDYRDSYEYAKKCEERLKKIDKNPFRWITPAIVKRTVIGLIIALGTLIVILVISNIIAPFWEQKALMKMHINEAYKAIYVGDYEKAINHMDAVENWYFVLWNDFNQDDTDILDKVRDLSKKLYSAMSIKEQYDNASVGYLFYTGSEKESSDYSIGGLVIDEADGKYLILLPNYDINMKYSNSDMTSWADSDLRKYLNCAFMEDELNYLIKGSAVLTTVVTGDEMTEDYVFLLSGEEAEKYKDIIEKNWRRNYVSWWLRDTGTNDGCMAYFDKDNNVCMEGAAIDTELAVCPAVWVDIDGGVDMCDFYEMGELLDLVS